jgi:GNAT superfamily N-acetyltransferase
MMEGEMDFVDKALARRLEAAEEIPQVCQARHYRQTHPESDAAVAEVAGGSLSFLAKGSLVGRGVGLGMEGPVTAEEVERFEEFYRSRGAPAQVDVCPYTDLGFIETLKSRGYVMAELNNVLYRRLGESERFAPALGAGVSIAEARPEQAEKFTDVLARCFFREGEIPPGFGELIRPMFQFPGNFAYFVEVEGKPAGTAAGQVIAERKMAAMFGDGTLEAYRGRGIQAATIAVRLQYAVEAGCDLAAVVTLGGSTSQKNYQRHGFQVAYSKATMAKNWGIS